MCTRRRWRRACGCRGRATSACSTSSRREFPLHHEPVIPRRDEALTYTRPRRNVMAALNQRKSETHRDLDAVVVGAGFAGLYMLYRLPALRFFATLLEGGADRAG